jgi:hypothetical protein
MEHNELDTQALRLAMILKKHHLGVLHTATNAVIAEKMGLDDIGSNGKPAVPGSRSLARLKIRARELGHPICSDHRGYYYATSWEEIQETVSHEEQCAERYTHAAAMLERAAIEQGFYPPEAA